jgi:uncharacterized membrane protein
MEIPIPAEEDKAILNKPTNIIWMHMSFQVFQILSAVPPPGTGGAEVVDWGSYKDEYKVGETATARLAIKNTGDRDIDRVELQGSIEKEFLGKFIRLIGDRMAMPIGAIKPGQTETIEQSGKIPNFPGRYRISVKVIADGREIGSFQKTIAVSR